MEEANWPQSFDMDHFKALTSFKARMDYCQAHLPRIGGGSGRMVYQIDDHTVIKLAKNAKGVAQNKAEDNDYLHRMYGHVITNVFDRHPDHLWIESQIAKKVGPSRFKQLSGGISIQDVDTWMRNYGLGRKGETFRLSQDKEISDRIWNNETFSDIASMANDVGMEYGDFGRLSSYGEVNGELVLVDYGLDNHTYSTYYEKKPKYGYAYEGIADKLAHKILIEAEQDNEIRNANYKALSVFSDYVNHEVPDYFIKEAGIEAVLDFLAVEDGMNLQLQWTNDASRDKHADFSRQNEPASDDELERILQQNKIPYSLKEVKNRLVTYFVRRLAYNTPKDKLLSQEEAESFLKTYEQKFLHGYLIPMAKINRDRQEA